MLAAGCADVRAKSFFKHLLSERETLLKFALRRSNVSSFADREFFSRLR